MNVNFLTTHSSGAPTQASPEWALLNSNVSLANGDNVKKHKSTLAISFALLSGCGEPSINIESVEFVGYSKEKNCYLTEKTVFSRTEENRYNWLIKASPTRTNVEVIEEIEAPAAMNWGEQPSKLEVSENGRKATTTITLPIHAKSFMLSTRPAIPFGPAGVYKARLIINGRPVKETSFTVE